MREKEASDLLRRPAEDPRRSLLAEGAQHFEPFGLGHLRGTTPDARRLVGEQTATNSDGASNGEDVDFVRELRTSKSADMSFAEQDTRESVALLLAKEHGVPAVEDLQSTCANDGDDRASERDMPPSCRKCVCMKEKLADEAGVTTDNDRASDEGLAWRLAYLGDCHRCADDVIDRHLVEEVGHGATKVIAAGAIEELASYPTKTIGRESRVHIAGTRKVTKNKVSGLFESRVH